MAVIQPNSGQASGFVNTSDLAGQTWPAGSTAASVLSSLPAVEIAVGTDGSTSAIETARTDLELAFPDQYQLPLTMGETQSATAQTPTELGVANVIIAPSLIIAGCSLAVGVAAGLSDRERPFSLLRLAGALVRCFGVWLLLRLRSLLSSRRSWRPVSDYSVPSCSCAPS